MKKILTALLMIFISTNMVLGDWFDDCYSWFDNDEKKELNEFINITKNTKFKWDLQLVLDAFNKLLRSEYVGSYDSNIKKIYEYVVKQYGSKNVSKISGAQYELGDNRFKEASSISTEEGSITIDSLVENILDTLFDFDNPDTRQEMCCKFTANIILNHIKTGKLVKIHGFYQGDKVEELENGRCKITFGKESIKQLLNVKQDDLSGVLEYKDNFYTERINIERHIKNTKTGCKTTNISPTRLLGGYYIICNDGCRPPIYKKTSAK